MVKRLLLGLLAATICGFIYGAPLTALTESTQHHHHQHHHSHHHQYHHSPNSTTNHEHDTDQELLEDPAARSERSTNLSHVTGTARKIQMFIKNRHLQILPDGTVNGTTDDTSAYSECFFS
ncbi:unnamed protein product [Acanthoscelides obtectus]|uniref:Uncharacterized protein n=1 Tax=Acanthoscelides obtectus TaxID=200917 RepID=A0A9P0LUU1_ACAOB|nr:unnamed protein product [Acanthoscelides obtectus]CAK1628706.1 hypothetical protein AOBTE_LOCUS5355 [Acanthoscelides obtectus]